MNVVVVCTVLAMVFSITIVLGVVIAMLGPTTPKHKNVISKEEYEKFLSQSKQRSHHAQAGNQINCPDGNGYISPNFSEQRRQIR